MTEPSVNEGWSKIRMIGMVQVHPKWGGILLCNFEFEPGVNEIEGRIEALTWARKRINAELFGLLHGQLKAAATPSQKVAGGFRDSGGVVQGAPKARSAKSQKPARKKRS